jgi:hypothetical protein
MKRASAGKVRAGSLPLVAGPWLLLRRDVGNGICVSGMGMDDRWFNGVAIFMLSPEMALCSSGTLSGVEFKCREVMAITSKSSQSRTQEDDYFRCLRVKLIAINKALLSYEWTRTDARRLWISAVSNDLFSQPTAAGTHVLLPGAPRITPGLSSLPESELEP